MALSKQDRTGIEGMGAHGGGRKGLEAAFLILCLSALFGCGGGEGDSSPGPSLSAAGPQDAVISLASRRIAYYETAQGIPAAAPIAETDEPFRMVDYGPQGELPAEIKRPSIYMVFSQPAAPLAKLGEPIRSDSAQGRDLLAVDPPLAGVFRWYGSRLLAFEGDGESLPQRRYTVTAGPGLRSLGGKSLEGERSFSFETERLSVLSWQLGDGESYVPTWNAPPEEARRMIFTFSYPVNLGEIKNWIEIRAPVPALSPSAAVNTWAFSLSRPPAEGGRGGYSPEQRVLLTLEKPLPVETSVEVHILPGARSEAGLLGSKEDQSFGFRTLNSFKFQSIAARSRASPHTEEGASIPLQIQFSQSVDRESALGAFSIEGLPPLGEENIHVYDSLVVLNQLPLEYRTSYRVRISADLKDRWGRTLGQAKTVTAQVGDADSYVYIHNRNSRMLEAEFPPRIVWEALNPVSISRVIRKAAGPYDQAAAGELQNLDISGLPRNSKRFFMEDLSPYLGPGGRGSAALAWNYTTLADAESGRTYNGSAWLSVQVTDIGLTVRYGYNRVLVWATRLSTGGPVANARAILAAEGRPLREAATDAQGLAVFDFPPGVFTELFTDPAEGRQEDRPSRRLTIRIIENGGAAAGGDEVEFRPNNSHNHWRFDVAAAVSPFQAEREQPVSFLFTDRGLYRSGETLSFRGIDRNLLRGEYQPYQGPYSIEASSGGYQAPVIARLEGAATENGGSYGVINLPADLDPGQYTLRYRRGDAVKTIAFQVANFERLRMEASLKFPDLISYAEEKLSGYFSASYLAGGALSGAPYSYYWTREAAAFNPGGPWQHWRFGPELSGGRYYADRGEGVLGPDGGADISTLPPADGIEGALYRYRLEASAQDPARQEISSRGTVMVHPAAFYIASRLDPAAESGGNAGSRRPSLAGGVPAGNAASRPSAWFLNASSPAGLSWALVSPEGLPYRGPAPQGGTLSFQLIRYDWKQARQAGIGGRVNLLWERVEELVEERTIDLSSLKNPEDGYSGLLSFTPDRSGQWELRLRGRDQQGRSAATRLQFYASGSGWVRWGSGDADSINLDPDRALYSPGDTARLMVRSPLPRGKYLLTVEREGIFSEKIIELEGSARTIDIPIEESFVPVVYVTLSSYTVRPGPPENSYYEPDLGKPKGLFGLARLSVDDANRHYRVEIEPSKGAYSPGEEVEVRIRVSLGGKPAAGVELSFMAVDRGVVDLIDYHVPDPLAFFYDPGNFPLGVQGADSRSLLIDPVTYSLQDLQGGDDEDSSKLDQRKDFRPTAVFEPFLSTGGDGTAAVKFHLPDSLTTYRCTAVAVGREEFGIAEGDLRVSAPLTATAALPRKLRWRDTGTVSLVLTNLEREAVEAQVSLAVEAAEAGKGPVLEIDGEAEKKLSIPPGASREVSFLAAAVETGEARLVFTLRSPAVNEQIIKTLTVDRPILYETVSTIGSLDSRRPFIEEGVVIPSSAPEGTGTLSLSLSASRLAGLKEAVGYLLDYPYGCLEQRTARLLPITAFGEHLAAFDLESPVRDPRRTVEEELALIAKNQLPDGSFPYWPGGNYGNFYVTLRVGHIAALAKTKGYQTPSGLDIPAVLRYISSPEGARSIRNNDPFLRGYALWVRAMLGERIGSEINSFLRRGDELGIAGYGFAGMAALELGLKDLAAAAQGRIKQFIRPGTRSLDLTDTYEGGTGFWGGDTDRYALALMLYHALSPADDMTSRLSTALLERQRRGIWSNTASSFWAVLAFGRIADAEKEGAGDLKAQASLGGLPLLAAEFNSYGAPPRSQSWAFSAAPLETLDRDAVLPLRIENGGGGRLFYSAGLRYGLPAEIAEPRDEGLGVFTETFDQEGKPAAAGLLEPGKTYTRRVVVSSSRDRNFVALRSPVPSGAEIVDASFTTSSTRPPAEDSAGEAEGRAAQYDPYFRQAGPPIRFIMDDEVRFHWDSFPAGRQEVEFRFRAVMPGIYPTPPSQAECMYEPEVFGRSAGELVIIGG
jgi:uncharacterized protein YfaS (alpha-2-macroglobulin family)